MRPLRPTSAYIRMLRVCLMFVIIFSALFIGSAGMTPVQAISGTNTSTATMSSTATASMTSFSTATITPSSTKTATATNTATASATYAPGCAQVSAGSITINSQPNEAMFTLINTNATPVTVLGIGNGWHSDIYWRGNAVVVNPDMEISTLQLSTSGMPMWTTTSGGLTNGSVWPVITSNNIVPGNATSQVIATFTNTFYNFSGNANPNNNLSPDDFAAFISVQAGSMICNLYWSSGPTSTPVPPTITNAPVCGMIQLGSVNVDYNNVDGNTVAFELVNNGSMPLAVIGAGYTYPSEAIWDTNAHQINSSMAIGKLSLSSYPATSPMWTASSSGLLSGQTWPMITVNNMAPADATTSVILTFTNVTYPFTGNTDPVYDLSQIDFRAVIVVQVGSTICSIFDPYRDYTPSATPIFPTATPTETATNTATMSGAGLTMTALQTQVIGFTETAIQKTINALTATSTLTMIPPSPTDLPPYHTIGVYRGGMFYLRLHNTTGNADITVAFNPPGNNLPITGRWTSNYNDTIGVFDQNTANFTLCTVNNTVGCTQAANRIALTFGNPNDRPLAGRWTYANPLAGVGVFRPGNGLIYLKNELMTGFADESMIMGLPGDSGIAGDWTNELHASPGVFRPGNITFYLSNQVTNGPVYADITFQFGAATDVPITGDWSGQGHDSVGMFRPTNGTVYLRNALTTGFADNTFSYGIAGDQPVIGYWPTSYSPIAPAPILITSTATPQPPNYSVPGDNQIGG